MNEIFKPFAVLVLVLYFLGLALMFADKFLGLELGF